MMTLQNEISDKATLVSIPLSENKDNRFYDNSYFNYDYSSLNMETFRDVSLKWTDRYGEVLPFSVSKNIKTLGEAATPLIHSKKYGNCFFKDEARNPSGCFKDRESAVTFPLLVEQGYSKFIIVSSGNAALSAALYASIYGVEVVCFVPKGTSETKKILIQAYGAKYFEVGEDYEDCYRTLFDDEFLKENGFEDYVNITSGVFPYRDQGNKIISFEIYDEIGVPDVVVVPSANGSLLFGIYNGFRELKETGLIQKIPKLISVQMKGGAPLKESLERKKDFVILDDLPDSKAEGIVAIESYCSPKAMMALQGTKGMVHVVSEDDLSDGMRYAIQEEGLFPEWSSASAFVALNQLYSNGSISEEDKVVVINTGSGLKDILEIGNSIK